MWSLVLPLALSLPADARRYKDLEGAIWVVVADPAALARKEKGKVLIGLAELVGVDVGQKVCASSAASVRAELAAEGVAATVACLPFLADGPTTWTYVPSGPDSATAVELGPGRYHAVRVQVSDPAAVAAREKGHLTVGVAQLLGLSIGGRVNEAVASALIGAFGEAGVPIYLTIR
jgi:hypothetical protein